MKIVVIGAGSRCFGLGQVRDVLNSPELNGRNAVLHLVDTDKTALDTMTKLAIRLKEKVGSDVDIKSSTDRCEALPGADYVIVAVARNRMQLWEQDFRIPLTYGFKHCLGENGGPGSLFHALRSFELLIPICKDVEKYCPDALVLNFTNPESKVLHAINHLTNVRAVGLCHGVFGAINLATKYLEKTEQELDIISAGINHFYFFLRCKDRATGEDLMPKLLASVINDDSGRVPPLFKTMAKLFDGFTYPSDDHIGEYLSYGAEFTGTKWHYGQECHKVSVITPAVEEDSISAYANGNKPIDELAGCMSGEIAVPTIIDIENNRGNFRQAVDVLNTDGYIDNLPRNAVVEVPAVVDAEGIHPLQVGSIPEPLAAYMRTQCSINNLLTEAYKTKCKRTLLQALLLDPTVNSVSAATEFLDYMLEMEKDYIPEFH